MSQAVELIRKNAHIMRGKPEDYDPLLAAAGNAKVVMIGEASHGTFEFYKERAEITKRLIQEKDVTAICVEADWPDAYRINSYVRGVDSSGPLASLADFQRFPRWMWRNEVMLEFVAWLRGYNDKQDNNNKKVGFYGLDLYSLFESAHAVIEYLDKADPAAAASARRRYACFDRFEGDSQSYGMAAAFNMSKTCQSEVCAQLKDMLERYAAKAKEDRFHVGVDEEFYATMNAKVVKDAEEYYRSMFGKNTWNMRDTHMVETLKAVMDHLERQSGKPTRAVVWAHNSHLGDASATESKRRGELNVGQLVRERWGKANTFNIGFTTYTGTVSAASEWDGPRETKKVRPGMSGSYEELMHQADIARFCLAFRSNDNSKVQPDKFLVGELCRESKLERAIGVIYKPETERQSHYFLCNLPAQFDSLIHIDQTRALRALDAQSELVYGEEETFPSGL